MGSVGTVTVDLLDGVWIVTLTGEHGLVNVEELRATMRSLVAQRIPGLGAVVVVDLTRVAFFDSSVAAVLVEAHQATKRDPDLHLALVVESADCLAARLLRALGLTNLLPTFTDRAALLSAVAQLRASTAPSYPETLGQARATEDVGSQGR
jgi:anti-anti-sigma factor